MNRCSLSKVIERTPTFENGRTDERTNARTGVTLNTPQPFFEWREHKNHDTCKYIHARYSRICKIILWLLPSRKLTFVVTLPFLNIFFIKRLYHLLRQHGHDAKFLRSRSHLQEFLLFLYMDYVGYVLTKYPLASQVFK